MKIQVISNMLVSGGVSYDKGAILTDKQFSVEYLNHLVYEAGAAVIVEPYETKVAAPVEETGPVVKKKRGRPRKKPLFA